MGHEHPTADRVSFCSFPETLTGPQVPLRSSSCPRPPCASAPLRSRGGRVLPVGALPTLGTRGRSEAWRSLWHWGWGRAGAMGLPCASVLSWGCLHRGRAAGHGSVDPGLGADLVFARSHQKALDSEPRLGARWPGLSPSSAAHTTLGRTAWSVR